LRNTKTNKMNIPVSELHNDYAPWNTTTITRCVYCDSEVNGSYDNYCGDSCIENHRSDMHNELIGMVDNIEWKMEKHLDLSTLLYKRAFELDLIDTCQEIKEMANDNGFYIKELKK
jgi:hypothetical protein